MFFFIKIPLAFIAIIFLYKNFNDLKFDLIETSKFVFGVSILTLFMYLLVCFVPYISINNSPLILSNTLIEFIKKDNLYYEIYKDKRGVFTNSHVEIIDGKVLNTHSPVNNPEEIYFKNKSHISTLRIIGNGESDKLISRLCEIEIELIYMINNQEEIKSFTK